MNAGLRRIVEIFLNRPRANGGWRNSLCVPLELLKMSIGTDASMQGLLEVETPEAMAEAVEEPKILSLPGWGPPSSWTPVEREFVAQCWREIWESDPVKAAQLEEEMREREERW